MARFVVFGCLLFPFLWVLAQEGSRRLDLPVHSSRVFRVPAESVPSARAMLADHKVIRLSTADLSTLFPGIIFDTSAIVDAQRLAHEKEALRFESLTNSSGSPAQRDSWRYNVRVENENAAYASTLGGLLKPYLLGTHVLNPGTGNYKLTIEGTYLVVRYGSLGRTTGPLVFVPLVVFLEKEPKHISVVEQGAM